MQLYMAITQTEYRGGARPQWLPALQELVVEFLQYNYIKQQLEVHRVTCKAEGQRKAWPMDNTIQHNGARLQALFAASRFGYFIIESKMHGRKTVVISVYRRLR